MKRLFLAHRKQELYRIVPFKKEINMSSVMVVGAIGFVLLVLSQIVTILSDREKKRR